MFYWGKYQIYTRPTYLHAQTMQLELINMNILYTTSWAMIVHDIYTLFKLIKFSRTKIVYIIVFNFHSTEKL